jgi:hypothetical protein
VERNVDAHISGKEIPLNRGTIHLEDSTGRIYQHTRGVGGSTLALDFEPLVAGVVDQGPITMVLSNLDTDLGANYHGSWRLPLSLEQRDAPSLPVPPSPVAAGDTRYTITSIVDSGFRLVIEWEARGGGVDRLVQFRREHPPESWRENPESSRLVHEDESLRLGLWPIVLDSGGSRVSGSRAFREDIVGGVYYGFQEIELPAPGEYIIRFGQFAASESDPSDDPGWPIRIDE